MSDTNKLKIDIKAFADVNKAIRELERLQQRIKGIEGKGQVKGGLTTSQTKQLNSLKEFYAQQDKIVNDSLRKEKDRIRHSITRREDALKQGFWNKQDLSKNPALKQQLNNEIASYKKLQSDRAAMIQRINADRLNKEVQIEAALEKTKSKSVKKVKDTSAQVENKEEVARQRQVTKDHQAFLKNKARERMRADDEEVRQTAIRNRQKVKLLSKEENFRTIDESLGRGMFGGRRVTSSLRGYTAQQLLDYRAGAIQKLKGMDIASKEAQRYANGIRLVNNELTKLNVTGGRVQGNLITPMNKFAHAAFNMFGLVFVFQRIGTAIRQLITRGAEFSTMQMAFKGTIEDMNNMRKASEGMLSDEKILGFSNKAQDLGIQMKEMPMFIDMALRSMKNYGIQLDDLPSVLEKVIKTTQTAQKELTSLGIPRPAFMSLVKKYSEDIIKGGELTKDIHKGDVGQYQYEREKLEETGKERENYLLRLNEEHQTRVKVKALLELYGKSLEDVTNKQQSHVGRILSFSAAMENFSNKLGQALIPLAETIFPKIADFFTWVTENSTKIATAFMIIGTAAIALTGALARTAVMSTGFILGMNPLFLIATAAVAAISYWAGGMLLAKQSEQDLSDVTQGFKTTTKEFIDTTTKLKETKVILPTAPEDNKQKFVEETKILKLRADIQGRMLEANLSLLQNQATLDINKYGDWFNEDRVRATQERLSGFVQSVLHRVNTGGDFPHINLMGTILGDFNEQELQQYSQEQQDKIRDIIKEFSSTIDDAGLLYEYTENGENMWTRWLTVDPSSLNNEALLKFLNDIQSKLQEVEIQGEQTKQTLFDSQYMFVLAKNATWLGEALTGLKQAFMDSAIDSGVLKNALVDLEYAAGNVGKTGYDANRILQSQAVASALAVLGISDAALTSVESLKRLATALQLVQKAQYYQGLVTQVDDLEQKKFVTNLAEQYMRAADSLLETLPKTKTESKGYDGTSGKGRSNKPRQVTGGLDQIVKDATDMGQYIQMLENYFRRGKMGIEDYKQRLQQFVTIEVPSLTSELFAKMSSIYTEEGGFMTIGEVLTNQTAMTEEALATEYDNLLKMLQDNANALKTEETTLEKLIEEYVGLRDKVTHEPLKFTVTDTDEGKSAEIERLEERAKVLFALAQLIYEVKLNSGKLDTDALTKLDKENELLQMQIDFEEKLLGLKKEQTDYLSDNVRSLDDVKELYAKEIENLLKEHAIKAARLNPLSPYYKEELAILEQELEIRKKIIEEDFRIQNLWEQMDYPNQYSQLLDQLRRRPDTKEGAFGDKSILGSLGFSDYTLVDTFFSNVKDIMVNYFSEGWQMIFGEANSMFEQLMQSFAQQLTEMLMQRGIMAILNAIFGIATGGVSTIAGGAIGMIGRASGGSIFPNQLYNVNERGTEMLISGQRGYILDANKTSQLIGQAQAMKAGNTPVNIYIAGVMDGQRFLKKEFPKYENFKRLIKC